MEIQSYIVGLFLLPWKWWLGSEVVNKKNQEPHIPKPGARFSTRTIKRLALLSLSTSQFWYPFASIWEDKKTGLGGERNTGVRNLRPWSILYWVNLAKLELCFPESPSQYGLVWGWPQEKFLWEWEDRSEAAAIFTFRRWDTVTAQAYCWNLLADFPGIRQKSPAHSSSSSHEIPSFSWTLGSDVCSAPWQRASASTEFPIFEAGDLEAVRDWPRFQFIPVGCSSSLLSPTLLPSFPSDCLTCWC